MKKIKQKAYKANAISNSQPDSSGNIPSIEITKENLEGGADYISDESEYQEGESSSNSNNNGRMGRRHSTVPPSPLPSSSSYAQHHQQSPQHNQYHQQQQQQQPQVNIALTFVCVARY